MRLFQEGEALRSVIVVGAGQAAAQFASFLEKRPWLGVFCAGTIGVRRTGEESLRTEEGSLIRPLGSLVEAEGILRQKKADELIVALDDSDVHLLPTVAETLRCEGLPFRTVPSLFEESFRHTRISTLGSLQLEVP